MEQILKAARLEKAELNEEELAFINQQTLRPLAAEEVFTFRLAACDNQVDRDGERFTEATLAEMAERFVGLPVLRDHRWSAETQTARVYAGSVEPGQGEGVQRLVLRCYMVRTPETAHTIAAIEGGILRECSVGLAVRRVLCSICGTNQREDLCKHIQGREYNGQLCHMDLDGVADAYEISLVAVPAQPAAGVIKSKRYGGAEAPEDSDPTGEAPGEDSQDWRDEALLELEKCRF